MSTILNSDNYNTLFSSLNKGNDVFNFSDYASIKNGSYGKVLKAYYAEQKSQSSTSAKGALTKTQTDNLSSTKTRASELKDSVSSIESALKDGDDKKLLAAVKDFASGYNTFLSSAEAADNKSITKSAKNLVNAVASNLKLLSDAGISIDEKGKMSVDESKVSSTSTALNTLFKSAGSFGDMVASKASSVVSTASSLINQSKNYTGSAKYADSASEIGKIYDSFQ